MIVFNGVSIDSVAPVQIEDIKVSPISYNPVTRSRALRWGSDFVRMVGGERTVTITLAMLDANMSARHEAFINLSEWAKTDAEYRMDLPTDAARYLTCVCTDKPEPSTRAWWENKLRLTFTCYSNPYWTSVIEKTVNCGTTFLARGDAPPLMRIENTFESQATNKTYANGTESMKFSTIPAGNMVIDLNRQTAQVGSTSIMQYYTPASTFVRPKVGSQRITGTGVVVYRERWE